MEEIFKRIAILGICTLVATSIWAQNELVDQLTQKYEDKSTINLLIKNHYDIAWKDGELDIKKYVTEERIYVDDKVSSAVKESVHFSTFYNLVSLEAASYAPKGNKYKKHKVTEFKEKSGGSGSIFYDDSKQKVFYLTNLTKGSKTKIEYVLDIKQPNLLSAAWLQEFYPTERLEVSISFPEEVEIGYKTFNIDESDYTFEETTKGGVTTYIWTRTEVEEFEYEYNGIGPRHYVPQLHPYIVSSKNADGSSKKHLGSVENLHNWYRELIAGYNENAEESSDELHRIVDSLTLDITDEKEKVKTIFSWVQRNIKYVAFEDGLAGFIPRPAAKVCTRRFGDCKDMASIITEMLDAAGIKGYLTWIGTRAVPFKYEEISTPSVDNHMIATYFDKNGKVYFLDATDRYMPFGNPADHIQGKEALVSISDTEYKIIEVPTPEAAFSTKYDSCYLTIDEDVLVGSGKQIQTGYFRNYSTYRLSSLDETELKDFFGSSLEKGNNKFRLEDFTLHNLKDFEKPIVIDYSFKIEDYIQSYEDELYIDMNLLGGIGTKIEDDREVPFDYRFKKNAKSIFVLEIPAGYEITYLPENYVGEMKDFYYTITYTQKGKQLIYEIQLNRSVMVMDKPYFEEWNKIYADMNAMFTESVVLKKKN